MSLSFYLNSILLGVGLAMDAFSVSLANGLNEPSMSRPRTVQIAGVYALFQFLMPMIGWFCVHSVEEYFTAFQKAIPWIAFFLLLYIGGSMFREGLKKRNEGEEEASSSTPLSFRVLMMQGIATSIDALSVGFTISSYGIAAALVCSLLIAAVTLVICLSGLALGKRFGTRMSSGASFLGGSILIFIGIRILLSGIIH